MNKELLELWQRAQQAWLEGCINAYGRLLNGAEYFLNMNKQYHEKINEMSKANKDNSGENK